METMACCHCARPRDLQPPSLAQERANRMWIQVQCHSRQAFLPTLKFNNHWPLSPRSRKSFPKTPASSCSILKPYTGEPTASESWQSPVQTPLNITCPNTFKHVPKGQKETHQASEELFIFMCLLKCPMVKAGRQHQQCRNVLPLSVALLRCLYFPYGLTIFCLKNIFPDLISHCGIWV